MSIKKPQKKYSIEEVRQLLARRKAQLAFDSYPKGLQEYLTRTGRNPYLEGFENRIEYRDFHITVKEK